MIPLHEDLVGDVRADAARPVAGRRARALHRVRQRDEPAAGARGRPRARDHDPHGARRGARPDRAPAPDRERAARLAGGAAGLLLAWWGVQGLIAVAPPSAPRPQEVRIDGLVLAFTALVTLVTAGGIGHRARGGDRARAPQRRTARRRPRGHELRQNPRDARRRARSRSRWSSSSAPRCSSARWSRCNASTWASTAIAS